MTRVPVALSLMVLAACRGGTVDVQMADSVPVELDTRDPEKFLRFALGSYTEGTNPLETGLLLRASGGFAINPQELPEYARTTLHDADGNGVIGLDELGAMLDSTYYRARNAPETFDEFLESTRLPDDDGGWFVVEVSGAMTAARRRVKVPREALQMALLRYRSEEGILYPEGTVIIGEHLSDDGQTVLETTAKRRRPDGFWDFFVFDGEGGIAAATTTEPRPLAAPTQCTGCHLGRRQFEPEESFPARSPDGPLGPRAYYVPDSWRRPEVATRFQEHARRSSGVLGIYGTLYVSKLLAERGDGEKLSSVDREILEHLGY